MVIPTWNSLCLVEELYVTLNGMGCQPVGGQTRTAGGTTGEEDHGPETATGMRSQTCRFFLLHLSVSRDALSPPWTWRRRLYVLIFVQNRHRHRRCSSSQAVGPKQQTLSPNCPVSNLNSISHST
ncbi:hypothetical protein Lal_00020987 [Lupinus albus]|nr:hypothetical protein Lal_00020987 [Lupinus albus]